MRKIWVLERFVLPKELREMLRELNEAHETLMTMQSESLTRESRRKLLLDLRTAIKDREKQLEENPKGLWLGVQGKESYTDFCKAARKEIRNHNSKTDFRVVEAEIPKDAEYWIGYKTIRVNSGMTVHMLITKDLE